MRLGWILLPLAPVALLSWPAEDSEPPRLAPRAVPAAPQQGARDVALVSPDAPPSDSARRTTPESRAPDPRAARQSGGVRALEQALAQLRREELTLVTITHLAVTEAPAAPSDGLHETRHANGAVASRGHYEAGRRVGTWSEWHPNGALAARGDYVYGAQHGRWRRWHGNGALAEEGAFVYGKRDGAWSTLRADGSRLQEQTYVNGRPDGLSLSYHADGALQARSTYRFGELHGPQTTWHANGQVACRGQWEAGLQAGRWTFFDEDGAPIALEGGWFVGGQRVAG